MLKAVLLAGASVLAFSGTSAQAVTFDLTNSVVSWTVPQTGVYDIIAAGGQGGIAEGLGGPYCCGEFYGVGGEGAVVGGDFLLTAGTTLHIVAGGAGGFGFLYANGGGGGGSFVFESSSAPLLIAGGGGGGGFGQGGSTGVGGPGQTGTAGQVGLGGAPGGANGSGGAYGSGGAGGGGWLAAGGSGVSDLYRQGPMGGSGPPSFAGGAGFYQGGPGFGGQGGFGGGGGGLGGGGGGGFSGGGGGYTGGGGGSYFAPGFSHTTAQAGANAGNGYVTINAVSTAPEPGAWSLLLGGLGFLGYQLRRRVFRRA